MINPKTILGEWVVALQALPNLVAAIGGDKNRIQFYSENLIVFGQQTQNNVRLAMLSMPPGSILIEWNGSGPARLGNMLVFAHRFKLYLRAPEIASVGYEDLFNWIVNDTPMGSTLRMLHTNIDPVCEPMDFYLPTAERNTVVISADGATFEYFEIRVPLIEATNP
jgi:hypothetical protein